MKVPNKSLFPIQSSALLVLVLSLSLILSASIWSYSFYQAQDLRQRGVINVSGVAEKNVTSDSADWSITLQSAQQSTKQEAVTDLQRQESELSQFLSDQKLTLSNFGKGDYHIESIERYSTEGRPTGEIAGYKSTITYRYVTNDVRQVEKLSRELSKFILDHDLTVASSQPQYLFSGLDPLKAPMLEEAVNNARERAVSMTKVSHSSPGKVVQASQGVFQVNGRGDSSVSDYGNFDTSSIEKTVRATVSIQFEIR